MMSVTLIAVIGLFHFNHADVMDLIDSGVKPSGRIVKGYNCNTHEYSRMVTIVTRSMKPVCGGSLINSWWTLTAAHCCATFPAPPYSYYIIPGMRAFAPRHHTKVDIEYFLMHKEYNRSMLKNDICLVKLTEPIHEREEVSHVKLPSVDTFEQMVSKQECNNVTIMGFGDQYSKPVSRSTVYNYHVQCVKLGLVGKDQCQDLHPQISDTAICAFDFTRTGKDGCQGDSGGPMLCQDIQVGIVSGGFGCGLPGYPSYYARTDIHADFISSITSLSSFSPNTDRSNNAGMLYPYVHWTYWIFIYFLCWFIQQ